MKKSILVNFGFCLLLVNSCAFAETISSNEQTYPISYAAGANQNVNVVAEIMDSVLAEDKDQQEIRASYKYVPADEENLTAYKEAKKLLYDGLDCQDTVVRKAKLGKAVELIANVCATEPDCVGSLFLASRIYRAYGGLAYAQSYQDKAVQVCKKELIKNITCRQAHLDLAIMYFAGDYRFSKRNEAYAEKAKLHAMEVLKETDEVKEADGHVYFQAALASMILGREKDCKLYLQFALDKNYPTDEDFNKIVADMIIGKFDVVPCNENNIKEEFLAYCFDLQE